MGSKRGGTSGITSAALVYKETEEEKEAKENLKAERQATRVTNLAEQKIKDMEKAREYQGRSSRSWEYMRLPAMEPIEATGISFENFEARIIHVDIISHMEKTVGRVYMTRVLLAIGNKKGAFSTGMAVGENLGEALRKAMAVAQSRIERFDLYQGKTIFHDVQASHLRQTVQIYRQPEGYGYRGNILFRYLCELWFERCVRAEPEPVQKAQFKNQQNESFSAGV